MNKYILSDVYRYRGKASFIDCVLEYLHNSAFRYMVPHRMINTGSLLERLMGRILRRLNFNKQLHIPLEVKIGYGLYIGHGGPVVINPTAKIGDNCNLSQFTTIGSNEEHAATIGDNVYIGPSVCIVEDVMIGNNVTIGAGSVVTKDIPENATAAGNYARVLNYRNPGRYIKRRWGGC